MQALIDMVECAVTCKQVLIWYITSMVSLPSAKIFKAANEAKNSNSDKG